MKRVLIFSANLPGMFLILRSIQRNIVGSIKYCLLLLGFTGNLLFPTGFRKIPKFIEILLLGTELFHVD
jgi:hypothetical protein